MTLRLDHTTKPRLNAQLMSGGGRLGESLKSKSYEGHVNDVLCKVVCHNLMVVISAIHELGLAVPQFGQDPSPQLVG